MGLPLQPEAPSRHRWLAPVLATVAIAGCLLALGLAGVARRPPTDLLVTMPGEPLAYARAAERLIAGARRRVWVMQYVVRVDDGPVGALLTALAAARARGVEVRVALDRGKLYGSDAPDPKNDAAAAWLAEHGIPVAWDEEGRTSHAKVLLVDDATAVIGSHNWTRSALVDNREVSAVVTDPRQVARIRELVASVPGW